MKFNNYVLSLRCIVSVSKNIYPAYIVFVFAFFMFVTFFSHHTGEGCEIVWTGVWKPKDEGWTWRIPHWINSSEKSTSDNKKTWRAHPPIRTAGHYISLCSAFCRPLLLAVLLALIVSGCSIWVSLNQEGIHCVDPQLHFSCLKEKGATSIGVENFKWQCNKGMVF